MKIRFSTQHVPVAYDPRTPMLMEKVFVEKMTKVRVRVYVLSNGVDIQVYIGNIFHGVQCIGVDENADARLVFGRVKQFSDQWFGMPLLFEEDARRTQFESYL